MGLRNRLGRIRGQKKKLASASIGLALGAVLAFGGVAQPEMAKAETIAYEFVGDWENAPAAVKAGSDVLSAIWRFDINDDSPAPSNNPVDNNVLTFEAENATFTSIPEVCLATGVTPESNLSADRKTLTCNIGTRNQGTAQVSFTGLVPSGNSGDLVSLTGKFLNKTVDLPKIPIVNPFVMDAKFDGASHSSPLGAQQLVSFGWSVSHSSGSVPGPASVSYDLTLADSNQAPVSIDGSGCAPISTVYAGYPFSDPAHEQERTTRFPDCSLTDLGGGMFRLTLSNLDYASPAPTHDSRGNELPLGMDVIAAGRITFKFDYIDWGTLTLSASTPTYISVEDPAATSTDDAANNTNALSYVRGSWTHAFLPQNALSQGAPWTDTYRTYAGASVDSASWTTAGAGNASCVVLDTKYVTFESARLVGNDWNKPLTGAPIWYFTGDAGGLLNPASGSYDPNAWTGCASDNPAADGWTTTLPSDLSTVRAVLSFQTQDLIDQWTGEGGLFGVAVTQTIKPTSPLGTAIWSWGTVKLDGSVWYQHARETDPAATPEYATATANARYPFSTAGRDVLRVVGSAPVVEKEVGQTAAGPGNEVDYTLRYGLTADAGAAAPAQVVLVDTLPVGLAYVDGSSTPEPVVTGTPQTGQTLTWTVDNVPVNKDPLEVIRFKALVPEDAAPGSTYINTVKANSQGQSVTASAQFVVPKAGYTTLTKTATSPVVQAANGVAENGWTIRMTSVDPVASAKTDTIDILPYEGDQRGTAFSGSYKLKQPVQAVAGATVYYTTKSPETLNEDPEDPSNGGFATTAGNTAGWSTTYNENATAIRVIGPALAFGQSQDFTVQVITSGSVGGDEFVNTAVGRASDTQMRMRTSDKFVIEENPAAVLRKYVRDSSGNWHDAQTATDFPSYILGDTARYRLVIENTGNVDLKNLPLTDTLVDLGQLFQDGKLTSDVALEGNAADGLTIKLLPRAQKATIEYDMVIAEGSVEGTTVVNTACVDPEAGSGEPAQSCDPAGVKVFSSLAWEKISAYSATTFLEGSEWELIRASGDGGAPIAGGTGVKVVDCVAAQATDCTSTDTDPRGGHFKVASLDEGWYRLVETKAPAGYMLDSTPHYVQVSGVAKIGEGIVNELAEPPMLPLTGGVGTFGFWVGGGLAGMLMAAGLFWQRRRSLSMA